MRARIVLFASLLVLPAFFAGAQAATTPAPWGSDLSTWWSYTDSTRAAALNAAVASNMGILVTDAKDGGPVGWANPTYTTITPFAAGDGAVERVVRDAHAKGIKVVARFDVFEDSVAAKRYPGSVIGGNPVWVDPACADVRAFVLAEVKDLVTRVAVDEVNFDHVRYPQTADAPASAALPCTGSTLGDYGHADRGAIVASWVKDASAAVRAIRPGIRVSASVFASTMTGAQADIGQDAARLAPSLDVLRPMVYPSYISSAAASAPYATVKDYTAKGVAKFGGAKVQPWVQAFGTYATRADLVCEQLKGARDAGASGALVWWFATAGTDPAFWKAAAPCAPAASSATTTTTTTSSTPTSSTTTTSAPAPLHATFAPKSGNSWWVETAVSADQPLASVSASVNGGAPVALAKTSWGTWAKSFYVPVGASVRFVATSTSGATNASANAYRWPDATPILDASFRLGNVNDWWVEAYVSSPTSVASVTASVDGGAPVALAKTSWGAWAKSIPFPAGSRVVFTATGADGSKAVSGAFAR